MKNEKEQLEGVRAEIDDLDQQIISLINQRAECAKKVAEIKIAHGNDSDFFRPEREAQILRKAKQYNPGPLPDNEVARLVREIMSACLALESPIKVAYLGPEGTFTQQATLKHFGGAVIAQAESSLADIFWAVESDRVNYGVIPIENSTEGVISHTLDLLINSKLQICGEVKLEIHHCLMGKISRLQDVSTIVAHQQSLAQCREWLATNLPAADLVPVSSNAQGAKQAAELSDKSLATKGVAAIASQHTADLYNLNLLEKNIEDRQDNTTRFLIIGKQQPEASGKDKTTLLLSAANRPNALYELLQPISSNGVNITSIESRPSQRENWDYVFFLDIDGHASDDAVVSAIDELKQRTTLFRVLGSYPKSVI